MGKDAAKPEEIYAVLVENYPALFQPLDKLPREIPHPGDEPKPPKESQAVAFKLGVNERISDLITIISEVNPNQYSFGDVRLWIERELVDRIHHNEDDEFSYWAEDVHGDPIGIKIYFDVKDPHYRSKLQSFNSERDAWRKQVEDRKNRKKKRETIKKRNADKINLARNNHRELWIAAGRFLKGNNNRDFLEKKIAKLQEEMEQYQTLLDNVEE